jgi:hypothetical protein
MSKIFGRPDINEILGMNLQDAKLYLESLNLEVRVKQDGMNSPMVSAEYNPNRVNVHIDKNIVVDIFDIG